MDPGLSNRKTSGSPCWPQHLEHYHTEHRCPTRLCAQPAALHAADPRLHCQVQLQPHHQVRWWHNSGRSYQQQQWNTLQRGSGTTGWPYHTKEKKLYETFLCNSKCATHRWVGLYKPPVVTHSPLCALDTFHTLLCVHNPTKDSAIYVCLHAHALQIILYCSPASCLTHNVSLCTCTVFMWSIRIVCIVCIYYFYFLSFIFSLYRVNIYM